tara:strand:+ start:602 stop:1252 length:651 start_codon:yes stop_codon:yes gene_type:complete
MNIIIFGPPGAGKGTQSDKIVKDYEMFKLSTGDLLREEIKEQSVLGKKIEEIVNSGKLVSDDIMNTLVDKIVSNKKYQNNIIFDGYPRNLGQAKNLEKILKKNSQKINLVISLKVSLESIVKRITGRLICSKCGATYNEFFNPPPKKVDCCNTRTIKKRDDDSAEVAKKRFNTYQESTEPVLKFYEKMGLLKETAGEKKIGEIYAEITEYINGIQG